MRRRAFKRVTRRLETEFYFGSQKFMGITSDVSERGIFIRTTHSLTPGSPVDIVVYLPDGKKSSLSGIVRRAIKTDSMLVKNGMGIELKKYDDNFLQFIKPLLGMELKSSPLSTGYELSEIEIIKCQHCGALNKISKDKLSHRPRCGKCKEPLLEE